MAKSLRSKWRRKCRAVKRVRYGEKELAQLKKTLGIDGNEVEMKQNLSEIATVVTKSEIITNPEPEEGDKMDEDGNTVKRVYNPKTMRDQFGNYPVWMNKRKLLKKTQKKAKEQKKKKKVVKRKKSNK